MYRFDVCLRYDPPEACGVRAAELMAAFGISRTQLTKQARRRPLRVEVGAGQIVCIVGAGGAGKTRLLRSLYEQAPANERLLLETIALEKDASAIDCIGQASDTLENALQAMHRAGLSDVFCMLRAPNKLSTGEQARYRLAKALSSERRLIFADEFTSSLDRVTALAAAFHLRKAATRSGKSFIIASCHEDIIAQLRADTVIRL
ncbi:MAG: ATP-binding cassette domain-containing protein [Planctomycetaceae bacterium]|nr:ATP-binding cassette domain-containing protein [Planctomycetaceae bacterium]